MHTGTGDVVVDDVPTVRPHAFYRGSGHPGEPVDRRPGAAERIPPPRRPETWRHRRTAALWGTVWTAARHVPEALAFAVADLAGRAAHRRADGVRACVRTNLSHVVGVGDLDPVVHAAFRSYARYWVEAFRAVDLTPGAVHARTTTAGFRHLDGVLAEGRGAIVLLAHHGSWDLAARWAETHGYHLAVVAEVLRPRALFRRFVRFREAVGLEVLPLARGEGSDERLAGRMGEVLAANHLVGLLTDRDLRGRAPQVELFGRATRIPVGAAVLATRHGTPIVPITMLQRPGRRWHLQILPPVRAEGREVADVHADVARALEDIIRTEPAQWHAFQPVWPDGDASPGGHTAAGERL